MRRHFEPILTLVSLQNLIRVYPKICGAVSSFGALYKALPYL
jgi:hypothetical protein